MTERHQHTSLPDKSRAKGFTVVGFLFAFGSGANAGFGLDPAGIEFLRQMPKPGETGTVVGRFSIFGTPTCPPCPCIPVVGGAGRALNGKLSSRDFFFGVNDFVTFETNRDVLRRNSSRNGGSNEEIFSF